MCGDPGRGTAARPRDYGLAAVAAGARNPQDEFGIVGDAERLAAETDRAGEDDLSVDAALIEHLEPHLRVPRPDVDVVDRPLVEPEFGRRLLAINADDRGGHGSPEYVPVEYPHRRAVDLLHMRHAVLVLLRSNAREQVGPLRPVRVGVDDQRLVVRHSCSR